MHVPLSTSTPYELGLAEAPLVCLAEVIEQHIAEGRYPGAQVALARHGRLALLRTFGDARRDPERVPAGPDTLCLSSPRTPARRPASARGVTAG